VGVEFYGRPTEALWFHLPRHLRRNVAICLNIGWVAHYASLGAHIYYWKYWDTQTWPGALAVNLPFVTSILFPIIGGIIQGKAENKVMEANPKRFPPSVGKYVRSAWAKYQEELRQGRPSGPGQACGVCCALFVCNKDFVKHLRAELQEMRKEQAEYEEMCGFEQKNMAGIIRQTDAESSTRKTTRSSTQGKTPPSSRTPASVEALPVKVTGVEADTVDAEQV